MKHSRQRSTAALVLPLALVVSLLPLPVPMLMACAATLTFLAGMGLGLGPASALFAGAGYASCAALAGRGPRGDLDSYASLAEIGTAIVLFALLSAWRRGAQAVPGPRWAGASGVLLALAGFCAAAHAAGIAGESARWSVGFVATPVLAFALAGLFCREGQLVGRKFVQVLAPLAAFFALRLPERCAWLAAPAALGLALLAADALESAPRDARLLGAAAGAVLATLALIGNPLTPVAATGEALDAQDEWVHWQGLRGRPGEFAYAVTVDSRVRVASVVLALVSEANGQRQEWPMQREAQPAGARFTNAPVRLAQLCDPAWSVRLELLGPTGSLKGERVIDRLVLPQAPAFSPGLAAFLAAAGLLCLVRGGSAWLAIAATLITAAQAAWLYARA